MSRSLPPLNGLRAFEAAARHLSFTRAAEELYVTQAAISHQVKGLEDHLGHAMFRRVNRGLVLSAEGQALYPAVRDGLDLMASAVRHLGDMDSSGALSVSTLDSIASSWLVPRLGRFRQRHPDIDVRLGMGDALVDFARDEIDLAIRYGRGTWSGCESCFLMNEEIFPVASPEFIEAGPGLHSPADLLKYPLLHDMMPEGWDEWFAAAGVHDVKPGGGISIAHSYLITQAAMDGQGIALGRSVLVADALYTGRLVRLFDVSLEAKSAYYLVGAPAAWQRPKIIAFRDWLLDEIAAGADDTKDMIGS